MRKYFFLLTFLLLLMTPINIHAQSLISYGVTEEGIAYQKNSEIITRGDSQITVETTYIYNGNVTVNLSIIESRTIDGELYTGTLYLTSRKYDVAANQTIATYRGILYKQ